MKSAKTLLEDNLQYVDRDHFDVDCIREYLENHEIIDSELFLLCFRGYDPLTLISAFNGDYSSAFNRTYYYFANYVYVPVDRYTFVRRLPFYFGGIATFYRKVPVLSCLLPEEISSWECELFFYELEWIYYGLSIPLETAVCYLLDQLFGSTEPMGSAEGDQAGLPVVNYYYDRKHSGKMTKLWIDYLHLVTEETEEDNFEMMPQCLLTALNKVRIKKGLKPILYGPANFRRYKRTANAVTFWGQFPLGEDGLPIVEWTLIRLKKPEKISFDAEKSQFGELRIECGPETVVSVYDPEDPDKPEQLVYIGSRVMKFDGDAFKDLRKEKNMSQKRLAEMLDVTPRTVQKWEHEKTSPDNRALVLLMSIFELTDPIILMKESEDNSHEKEFKKESKIDL